MISRCIRKLQPYKFGDQRTRQGLGTEQNGDTLRRDPARELLPDVLQHERILLQRVGRLITQCASTRPLYGCDFLREAMFVPSDDLRRKCDDFLVRTIVIGKCDACGTWIIALEAEHDAGIRAPEGVDRLVVIPDDEKIVFRQGEHTHDFILKRRNILELIYEQILVLLLPATKLRRLVAEELTTAKEHIIEVHEALLPQALLITQHEGRELLVRKQVRIKFREQLSVPLETGDLADQKTQKVLIIAAVDAEGLGDFTQHLRLRPFAQDVFIRKVIADAEDKEKDRVEGAEVHLATGITQVSREARILTG